MQVIKYLCLFVCLAAAPIGFAQNDLSGGASLSLDDEPTFLPVEEAYQVSASTSGDNIFLDWNIQDGYYLYKHQFKLKAVSEIATVELPITFGKSKKKYDEYFEEELDVFYKQTRLTTQHPDPTKTQAIELHLIAQGCADAGLCYPPENYYFALKGDGIERIDAPTIVESASQDSSGENASEGEAAEPAGIGKILSSIIFAMLGGMILNLMPCVFPVLSLKALSFASSKDDEKPHVQGWMYTAGVVLSFMIAASVILIAKSAGNQLGWGFQLQSPGFVGFMVYLFFAMGLSLSGMFHIGTQWMGAGQNLTSGHGPSASFFTGVLAAVVASPCTAPLMAPAIGFALTQNGFVALTIFASLGFGMALPFLALSYSPKLASYMPNPGPWMDTLKQLLAFPLYVTCIWLIWVVGRQTNATGMAVILCGCVSLTFGIWLWERAKSSGKPSWFSKIVAVASIAFMAYAGWNVVELSEEKKAKGDWEIYSPELLSELRDKGYPVFIDLTADWCITCKANEKVALTDKVKKYAKDNGIAMLVGDWTKKDPVITELLTEFNRSGVPLYLMYPADKSKSAKVLPQILKESTVLDAMKESL